MQSLLQDPLASLTSYRPQKFDEPGFNLDTEAKTMVYGSNSTKVKWKIKGSSSVFSPKKIYQVKPKDDLKYQTGTLNSGTTYVFRSNIRDVTCLSNYVTYSLSDVLGLEHHRMCGLHNLYINGMYHGVYLLLEIKKRDEVYSANMVDHTLQADENIDTQYPHVYYKSKGKENGKQSLTFRTIIDYDVFVKYIYLQELTLNTDGYRRDLYIEPVGADGVKHSYVWDGDIIQSVPYSIFTSNVMASIVIGISHAFSSRVLSFEKIKNTRWLMSRFLETKQSALPILERVIRDPRFRDAFDRIRREYAQKLKDKLTELTATITPYTEALKVNSRTYYGDERGFDIVNDLFDKLHQRVAWLHHARIPNYLLPDNLTLDKYKWSGVHNAYTNSISHVPDLEFYRLVVRDASVRDIELDIIESEGKLHVSKVGNLLDDFLKELGTRKTFCILHFNNHSIDPIFWDRVISKCRFHISNLYVAKKPWFQITMEEVKDKVVFGTSNYGYTASHSDTSGSYSEVGALFANRIFIRLYPTIFLSLLHSLEPTVASLLDGNRFCFSYYTHKSRKYSYTLGIALK
jgi:hypothetical protein